MWVCTKHATNGWSEFHPDVDTSSLLRRLIMPEILAAFMAALMAAPFGAQDLLVLSIRNGWEWGLLG